ncbi:MAG: hypothetical protein EKK57_00820 [Proteobacteria bacterium]|nr:MAG: hypothetical protein EKK57_00820 [Pseudomonadota bacterium]
MLIILLATICVLALFMGYYLPSLIFIVFCLFIFYFRYRQKKSRPKRINMVDNKIQSESENQQHNKIIRQSAPLINDYLSNASTK